LNEGGNLPVTLQLLRLKGLSGY